jgi:hypothetical protein
VARDSLLSRIGVPKSLIVEQFIHDLGKTGENFDRIRRGNNIHRILTNLLMRASR